MKKIKLCALLLVVILNSMFVSSCIIDTFLPYRAERAYESGWIVGIPSTIKSDLLYMSVKSDVNTFAIDNIELDFYIGLYTRESVLYSIPERIDSIVSLDIVYLPFYYITTKENKVEGIIKDEISIKNISLDDAKTGKYSYDTDDKYVFRYDYVETLKLPSEYFTEETGRFFVILKCVSLVEEKEVLDVSTLIYFEYDKIDDNNIKLIFNYNNYKSEDRAGSASRYILPFIKEYYKIDDSQQ